MGLRARCLSTRSRGFATPSDGAELWEVFSDGSEKLIARFSTSQNKFISEP
ncbi:MAG: hypothetical protein ACK504_02910 [Bacteroidota bacterium]